MRKILLSLLLLSFLNSKSQDQYYDAMKLRGAIRWIYVWNITSVDPDVLPTTRIESEVPFTEPYIKNDTIIGGKHIHFVSHESPKIGFSSDLGPFEIVKSVLRYYSNQPNEPNFSTIKTDYANNVFIYPYIINGNTSEGLVAPGFTVPSLSSVGGLNVTNFADGISKFLVKRFKQELTITFFQKFEDEISKSQELKTLFPETFKVLLAINKDIYQFSAYLNTLREAFIKDLTGLYTNFKKFTQLDKYKTYFSTHPELNTIITSGLYLIDQYAAGVHAGEVLAKYDTGNLKFSNVTLQHNIRSSVALIQAVSGSFKSVSPDHYWVPADSVKSFFEDSISRNLYLGLVYQKYGSITFEAANRQPIRFDALLATAKSTEDSLIQYQHFFENFIDHAQEVSEYLSEIRPKQKADIDYNDYYKLYNSSLDLFQHAFTFIDLPFVSIDVATKETIRYQSNKWLFVSRSAGSLYIDIRTKNYSSAILTSTGIADTLFAEYHPKAYIDLLSNDLSSYKVQLKANIKAVTSKKLFYTCSVNGIVRDFSNHVNLSPADLQVQLSTKGINDNAVKQSIEQVINTNRLLKSAGIEKNLTTTFLKYGTFASTVATAKNSDDVEAAIEAVALPVGSASIKKGSSWNISLNAYVGGFAGREYLSDNKTTPWAGTAGLTAPIGVAVSHRVGNGSLSLFVPILDVGAFASYRLNDTSSAKLPDVTLQNIFAPGVGLVFGIPKLPISIGGLYQWGPAIRGISNTVADIKSGSLNQRWEFFIGVDIPILNFYTKSK